MKIKRIVLLSAIVLTAPCTAYATNINGICYGNPSSSVPSGTFDPNDPSRSGYSLVFDSEFNTFNDFDLSCAPAGGANVDCTTPPGKSWYLLLWPLPNGNNTTPQSNLSISNGVLTIQQTLYTVNQAISSIGPHLGASHGSAPWQQGWNGTVFTGGWYAEARIADQYTDAHGNVVTHPPYSRGHAAFWSMAIDSLNGSANWPGQPANYKHFVEDDMLDGIQDAFYSTFLLDFYGTNAVKAVGTGMNIYDQINVTSFGFPNPSFVNKTSFHVFGQLWVPATSTTQGYLQNYLDGVPTSRFSWNQYNPNTPPPPTGSNIANIIDQDHMNLILGADPPYTVNGVQDPRVTMFIDWVHVWQLDAARTASGNTVIPPQINFTGGNGSCALSQTVTGGLPDLISTSISYNSTSGNFTSVVSNQGNAATPAGVVIGVAYNVDGVKCTWGGVYGPLAAGASVTIGTQGGACPISTGTHTIAIVADDANRITESNKNNNTLSQTIQVP